MDDKNWSDLGRQMSDAVQNALRVGDYSQLKQTINSTMGTVVDKTISYGRNLEQSIEDTVSEATRSFQQGQSSNTQKPPFSAQEPKTPPPPRAPSRWSAPSYYPTQAVKNAAVLVKQRAALHKKHLRKASFSSFSGIFMIVIGCLGAIPLAASALAMGLTNWLGASFLVSMVWTGAFSAMSILFALLFIKGIITHNRAKRCKVYLQMLGAKNFCEIDKMADMVQKSPQFVKKELRRLLGMGMFPEGHMDELQTCMMLGEDTYRQYLEVQENLKQREAQKLAEEARAKEEPEGLSSVIAEGKACLQQIRNANSVLPGEEISAKLYRLETVTEKIFEYVQQRPKKLPEIHRFMSYYLPTTIKLVTSYQEFEAQPVQGANIVTAKAEILEILGTINAAFETLLDSLFEDDAMDISTDISALKTMLAQEGLAEKDFKSKQN